MKNFKNTFWAKISLLVAFALLVQIAVPIYAEEVELVAQEPKIEEIESIADVSVDTETSENTNVEEVVESETKVEESSIMDEIVSLMAEVQITATVDAGPDMVITAPQDTVTLTGTGSVSSGSIRYAWAIVSGGYPTIETQFSQTTEVSGLVPGVYQFKFMVQGDDREWHYDFMTVTVNSAPDTAPTANAGYDIYVYPLNKENDTVPVTITGTATDDGTIEKYLWEFIKGPGELSATVETPESDETVVNLPTRIDGPYTFRLTVTDDEGNTDTDEVDVYIKAILDEDKPQCQDGLDNDGDGKYDMQDPGCGDANDDDETDPVVGLPQCQDGLDNDGDGLYDMLDPGCTDANDNDETNPTTGLPQCQDGLDNDGDGKYDMFDAGCTDANDDDETDPTPTPVALCQDGLDNDSDGLIDASDPGCHSDNDASNSGSYVATDNDESDQTSGGGGGGSRRSSSNNDDDDEDDNFGLGGPDEGQVLGATTMCGETITSYIKLGQSNFVPDVIRLKAFLNRHMGTRILPTGNYDAETYQAVKMFQVKETPQVLTPWANTPGGIDMNGTGYVYKTTTRWINMIECPALNIPMPILP